MKSKEHDLMLNILANPQASIEDFLNAGLSAKNTSLEDENTYLSLDAITSNPLFQNDSGEFDKVKFHNVYLQAAKGMYTMNTEPQDFKAVYSKYNSFAPIDLRDNTPQFELVKVSNPDRLTKSMLTIGLDGPREYTPAEIAQSQLVWDSKRLKWMDTPEDMFSFKKLFNDFTGFFSDNFGSTKVLAQYDEDVDINGKKRGEIGFDENNILHSKGEYMLNDNGTYYYRTLKDGENIYGKQVLHYSDILTREGSALNAVDFLDSDDIKKNPFGAFVKDAALIGAMFIPGGVGTAIAGATIVLQAMGLGATLGKIALGSDSTSMNWIEGLVEATNPMNTKSEWSSMDYGNTGRNVNWTTENLLMMIADVVGQLKQQRMLFKYLPAITKGKWGISLENQNLLKAKYLEELNASTKKQVLSKFDPASPKYLKASTELYANNVDRAASMVEDYMKSYYKSGEELSRAYMTLLTVNDIYGEAKEAGAEDFDAALVTAGYAAMEYALLSTDIGKWVLPELRNNRLENKAVVRALTKETLDSFKTLGKAAAINDAAKKSYILKVVDFGKSVAKGEFASGFSKRASLEGGEGLLAGGLGSVFAGAMAEGIEETTEELLGDFSRVLYNGLESLRGKDSRMDSFEGVFDRYTLSFLGGFVGGGITGFAEDFSDARRMVKMDSKEAVLRLVYKAHNNDLDGILKIIKNDKIGNENLSATKFDVDEDGNRIWQSGDESDNLDAAIKRTLLRQINLILNTLNAHGGNLTDDSLIDALTLKNIRYRALQNTTTAGLFILKYNELLTNLVLKTNELNSLNSTVTRAENDEKDGTKNEELELRRKKLEDEIKEIDEEIVKFNNGSKAPLFMLSALLETTPFIASPFMSSTFKIFAEREAKTSFDKIPESELEELQTKYQNYLKTTKKDDVHLAAKSYVELLKLIRGNLEESVKTIEQQAADTLILQMLDDTSVDLLKLDWTENNDQWIESYEKFAKKYSDLGDDLHNLIKLIRNSYAETISNIDTNERAALDALNTELNAKLKEQIDKIEEAFNLGELGGGISEENRNTSIEQIRKDIEDERNRRSIEITTPALLLREESKLNLENQINDAIFKTTLKQANNIADRVLSLGFLNGAIKTQVLGKLNSVIQTVTQLKQQAEKEFIDKWGADVVSFYNQGQLEEMMEVVPELAEPGKEYLELLKKFNEPLNELKGKLDQIEKLGYTPIMLNLDTFALSIGKQRMSDLFLSLGNNLNSNRQNISSFNIGKDVYAQIFEADRVLDLYIAALEGARTDTVDPFRVGLKGTDNSNIWGINKVINEIHLQAPKVENDDWEDLIEISGTTADMMIEDVKRLKKLLNSYKVLYNINQGKKLEAQGRVGTKTVYLLYDRVKRLLSNTDLPDKEKLDDLVENLKFLKELTSGSPAEWNINLSLEERTQLEKEKIQLEDAIFDYFSDKLDNIEVLKLIFNPKHFKLSDSKASLLSEGSEYVDDSSFVGYLAATAALKSSSFQSQFKEILREGGIAPIVGQEISVRLGLANILNGNAITNIIKAYRESILELPKDKLKDFLIESGRSEIEADAYTTEIGLKILLNDDIIPQYDNITFIDGIPGSGKSKGVDLLIVKFLLKYNPELLKNAIVSHGGDNGDLKVTTEFAEAIGITPGENNIKSRQQLLEFFSSDYKHDLSKGKTEYKKNDDYVIDEDGKILPTWKVNNDLVPPSIIFIDEAQQFTQLELLFIDKVAKLFGIPVVMSGDLDLSQTHVNINFETLINAINLELKAAGKPELTDNQVHVSLARNLVLHAPKLGTSMRTSNNLKNINISETQAAMLGANDTIHLHYYEDETALAGDMKSDGSVESVTTYVDKMLSLLEDEEKINFAYSPDNLHIVLFLKKLEKYNGKINYIEGTALGLEGKFWIIQLGDTGNSTRTLQDFYTGQTRSKQFSLMIVPDSIGDIKIENVWDSETHEEQYNPDGVKRYSQLKISILEQVLDKKLETLPYNPRNTVAESKPIVSSISERKEKLKTFAESFVPVEGALEFKEEPPAPPETPTFEEGDEEIPIEEITDLDDSNEKEAQEQLNDENGVNPTEEKKDSPSKGFGLEDFSFNLYSNATFEIGTSEVDEENNTFEFANEGIMGNRIDGVNGITHLKDEESVKIQLTKDLSLAIQKLGGLRRKLLSIEDKATMERLIAASLAYELDGKYITPSCYIRFAIKTSSFDTRFIADYGKLEKGEREPLLFARALREKESESNFVNNRNLVAIIGLNGEDAIEIPLLTLANPNTIIKSLDEKNPVRVAYEAAGESIAGLQAVLKAFNTSEYAGLNNLISLYLNTYRNILFIDDLGWTPSNGLNNLGVQLNIHRGWNSYNNPEYILTLEWIDLDELKADPSIKHITKPMHHTTGVISSPDGKFSVKIANPKHPFILYTDQEYSQIPGKSATSLDTDQALMDEFIYLQLNGLPTTVLLLYILPPKFDLLDYIESLKSFMINKNGNPLGNQRTPFKILAALYSTDKDATLLCFKDACGEETGIAVYNKVGNLIKELSGKSIAEQAKILTTREESWSFNGIGIPKNVPLHKLLRNILKQLVYPLTVVFDNTEGRIYISNTSINLKRSDTLLQNLNTIFTKSGVDLYYQTKAKKGYTNGFIPLDVNSDGHIVDRNIRGNGGFTVNGSVSSRALRADSRFNNILATMMEKRVVIKSGMIVSRDDKAYISGYSGWRTTTPAPTVSNPPSLSTSIVSKLSRFGITTSVIPTTFLDDSVATKLKIANEINSLNSKYKAIVLPNGDFIITDELPGVVLFNLPTNAEFNGSLYEFPMTIDGVPYNAVLYNNELKVTELSNKTAQPGGTSKSTLEFTNEDDAKEFLKVVVNDPSLREGTKNVINRLISLSEEEFINNFNALINSASFLKTLMKLRENNVEIEKLLSPVDEPVDESTSCPISKSIKFI